MQAVELSYDVYEPRNTHTDTSPIIITHGLFWNKFMYRDLARDLCEETNRKIYCLDLRNHGDSPVCDECDTFLMTEDVKRFLDEQGLKRVVFVCHSFSSAIGYLITLERPESVEKLVMIDHPPFGEYTENFIRNNVSPQVEIQNKLLARLDPNMRLREAKTRFYDFAKFGTKGQEIFYKKAAYDLTKEKGQFKWKIDIDFLMGKYRQRAFAPKARGSSNHEILIVRCKDSDRVSDSKFEAVLKFNPRARLVTLDDTTHLLMFEKSAEFIEIVKDFLNEPEKCTLPM